jgi:acylphosphatase
VYTSTGRVRLEITGRVQGVGFRYWAAREARRLGLHGTVRNRADGAVELEAEGEAEQLDVLRERLGVGPPHARVARVVDLPAGEEPLPAEFRITG